MVLFFVAILAVGGYAFGGPNGQIPGFVALPAVFAFFLAVIGRLIAPRVQAPFGECWTELRYGDNG